MISVLGSTGSVGRQALEAAENIGACVLALTGGSNVSLMEEQARRHKPRLAVMADEESAKDLRLRLRDTATRVEGGAGATELAAAMPEARTVVSAIVGTAGLLPTLAAVQAGKRVALANKESLVCAGSHIMRLAKLHKAEIIPVDSEHSAVFQCLKAGENPAEVSRILLTASGGPFFGKSFEELETVTSEQALAHPNWRMGAKITVDCATLMNKGLELIEAMHLFSLPADRIEILIHRESLIHSMVEFCDGAVIAQLAEADMRLPIQYALTYPKRAAGQTPPLDLVRHGSLSFFEPDLNAFRCLGLALDTAKRGGNLTAALSAANETAVELFLREKAGFNDIWRIVETTLTKIDFFEYPSIEDILDTDADARRYALEATENLG